MYLVKQHTEKKALFNQETETHRGRGGGDSADAESAEGWGEARARQLPLPDVAPLRRKFPARAVLNCFEGRLESRKGLACGLRLRTVLS